MLKHIEKRAGASSSKDSRDMMTMSNMRNRGAHQGGHGHLTSQPGE